MGADTAIIMQSHFDLDKPEEVIEYFTKQFDVTFADRWLTFVSDVYKAERRPVKYLEVEYYKTHTCWQEFFAEFGFLRFGGNHMGMIVSRGSIMVHPLFRFGYFADDKGMFDEICRIARSFITQLKLPEAIIIPDEPISFAASILGSSDPRLENDPNLHSLDQFYRDHIFKPGEYGVIKDFFKSTYGEGITEQAVLSERGGQGYVVVVNPSVSLS